MLYYNLLPYSLTIVSCTVSTFEVVVCYSLSYFAPLTVANNSFSYLPLFSGLSRVLELALRFTARQKMLGSAEEGFLRCYFR